ncbi:MAG: type II toxin-antitoxin system PemK/MazF family toxin [Candidatus Micrarchaeota archaeon]
MEQLLNPCRRDIVLVPFPFSDQSGSKRRPALIVSSDKFNAKSEDVVALAITSFCDGEPYEIAIKAEDWKDGLYSESYVKAWAIGAIDKGLVIKRIGRLAPARYEEAVGKMREIIG